MPRLPFLGTCLALGLAVPASLPAQAVFQGSITYRMTLEGMSVSMTMASKGAWTRTDMELPGMPGQMFVLMNTDSMVARTVMLEMGMYVEMDLKTMMGAAEELIPQSTRDSLAAQMANASFESLGTSDEIAGHTCRNYRFRTGTEEMESCIATGLGSMGTQMGSNSPMAGLMPGMPDMAAYQKEFPDGFLALRVRLLKNGTWEPLMEATKIDRTVPGDELFKLPPGLTRMDPPSQ